MMAIEAARHGAAVTMAVIPEAMETAVRLVGEAKEKISGAEISITSMDSISGEFDLLIKLRLWECTLRPAHVR